MKAARIWLALVLGVGMCACVKQYQAPALNEPHAVVKIRRAYHVTAGTTLNESASVTDGQVFSHSRAASLSTTETSAVRVHPGRLVWIVSSGYSHTVSRQVQETYHVQESYSATETYNCGSYSSTGSSYRSCTRQVTRYRSVPKQRTVTRQVPVSDGDCQSGLSQLAEEGHVYLLQYSYTGPGICSLQCLEQVPASNGGFETRPCPPAPRQ